MNSSSKSFLNGKDAKLNSPNKVTTLNPNAAEFVPSALRSLTENNMIVDVARLETAATSVKPCLDRSESNVSNSSDDEAHQFWRRQLPDDITPDFKIMGEEELQASSGLSIAGLSINDGIETSGLSMTMGSQFLSKPQEISPRGSEHVGLSERMAYSGFCYSEDNSTALMNLGANPWDKQFMNGDQFLSSGEGNQYVGDSNAGFLNELLNEHGILESAAVNPVEFLASQFPGFAADSLTEVYYANGCDLNMTIEILAQLELQVDNRFNQNINSKTLSAPSLSALDFPALSVPDSQDGLSKYSGEDLQQAPNALRSVDKDGFPFLKSNPSGVSRATTTPDFASAVRRLASQDSGHWKNERNGSTDISIGPSRNSQLSAGSYNGHGKNLYADKLQYPSTGQTTPAWLETGDSVAQIYSESREEARDLARLRNACFEQARQAYIIGNKALAKELSTKGQLYNIQMKEAHEKARESIYRQRNPVAPELQFYNRGKDPLIDLHGLHVNEAINVLKHELNILRRTARSSGQRLQVVICVGTGHHTKGSRTPVRLPVAVQRYLLDEKLQFAEDQPGLLRVVIC